MKRKLLLLALPFLLVGCTNDTPVVPPAPPEVHDLSYKYEDLANDPDYEEVSTGCSLGEWFLDINTDRCLATDSKYVFSFEANTSGDTSFTVTSSHPEHAEVEMGTGKIFYLNTKTAGDTILSVYNSSNFLCYRHIVRVRPKLAEDDVLDFIIGADHFETIPDVAAIYKGSWKYTLLDNVSGSSIFNGQDEMEADPLSIKFDLDFVDYYPDSDFYAFEPSNEKDYSANTYISTICFTAVGDLCYVYYKSNPRTAEEHLLTILYNSDIEYLYKPNKR